MGKKGLFSHQMAFHTPAAPKKVHNSARVDSQAQSDHQSSASQLKTSAKLQKRHDNMLQTRRCIGKNKRVCSGTGSQCLRGSGNGIKSGYFSSLSYV